MRESMTIEDFIEQFGQDYDIEVVNQEYIRTQADVMTFGEYLFQIAERIKTAEEQKQNA